MAQWTGIDPNTLLPGDPWTSAKAQAAFENVEALAEGAPGAPFQVSTWHPWDTTTNGAGGGLIYDHAVDGSVTAVFTPVFEFGYEYRLLGDNLDSVVFGGINISLRIEGGSFVDDRMLLDRADSSHRIGFDTIIHSPMLLRRGHLVSGVGYEDIFSDTQGKSISFTTRYNSGARRFDQARVRFGSGSSSFTSGRVWLYRRKVEGFE